MVPFSPSQPASSSARKRNRDRLSRPRGRPRTSDPHSTASNVTPDFPPKKRKYVPGGPGGGGRYVDVDGTETPVGGTGPGGYAYSGSRGRVGRENAANGIPPTPKTYPRRRERPTATPRFSSAAAAAAAAVQGDGYKPREERGWEEFHPDMDIDASLLVFGSAEVDGTEDLLPNISDFASSTHQLETDTPRRTPDVNGHSTPQTEGHAYTNSPTPIPNSQHEAITSRDIPSQPDSAEGSVSTPRRWPGRPRVGMESPAASNKTPKSIPRPTTNPREKLTLPQPSFRKNDPFISFEQNSGAYVDKSMANVGYQESDIFARPDARLIRVAEGTVEEDLDLGPSPKSDGDTNNAMGGSGFGRVEYDMDEQDDQWLVAYNTLRQEQAVETITREIFEITMTKIEKEWHSLEKRIPKPNPKPPQTQRPRSSSAAAVNGEPAGAAGEEQDSKCAICDDGDCENTNAIVFCDGCDLAVHQECYGVPFIPEGQWLCRKCQLIGRGTPTCIFCPNIDGAFKQTNSSRWSHLLCAIWIPEVNLGNTAFMEPVMDVERVPKGRWKLTCYICRQKMGACIQCSNKNCFIAFHVTCARRARLYLKMKGASGGPANLEPSALKALCDKHVPPEWRRENDVDAAILDAQDFYRHTMRNRLWADSQQSAIAMTSSHVPSEIAPEEALHTGPRINLVVGSNKKKRTQPAKAVWRLPSGAPVIPQAVYNSVESSLQRFNIRKRKEYVAEACKFWTLKREARRGAALLKRLQLQMETFSSMEITRRNFAGMGAAGRVRLQRRIDFAHKLRDDVEKIRALCEEVKNRENEKLKDVDILREVVDTVYFPIPLLLWPILERAQSLDGKGVFKEGLQKIRSKLEGRFYTSVVPFSADLGTSFSNVIGLSTPTSQEAEPHAQLNGIVSATVESAEQKEKKKLAKRIIRAIQPSLEDATRKEVELSGRPFEKEALELDALLASNPVFSPRASLTASVDDKSSLDGEVHARPNGIITSTNHGLADTPMPDAPAPPSVASAASTIPPITNGIHLTNGKQGPSINGVINPVTAAAAQGGVPWYIREFDPMGIEVSEERWTGREVVRGMSEELSSMDEAEVRDLGGDIEMIGAEAIAVVVEKKEETFEGVATKVVEKKKKKRPKRQR